LDDDPIIRLKPSYPLHPEEVIFRIIAWKWCEICGSLILPGNNSSLAQFQIQEVPFRSGRSEELSSSEESLYSPRFSIS